MCVVTSPRSRAAVNDWPRPLCGSRQPLWALLLKSDWSIAVEKKRNYGRGKRAVFTWPAVVCSPPPPFLSQSFPVKMAYHSPYRAPPQINAPPDQSFLWNIFQRWVRRSGLFRLSLRSAVNLRCCQRREERRTGVVVVPSNISVTVRFCPPLSFCLFFFLRSFQLLLLLSKGPQGNWWRDGGNTTAVSFYELHSLWLWLVTQLIAAQSVSSATTVYYFTYN